MVGRWGVRIYRMMNASSGRLLSKTRFISESVSTFSRRSTRARCGQQLVPRASSAHADGRHVDLLEAQILKDRRRSMRWRWGRRLLGGRWGESASPGGGSASRHVLRRSRRYSTFAATGPYGLARGTQFLHDGNDARPCERCRAGFTAGCPRQRGSYRVEVHRHSCLVVGVTCCVSL